ncbi:MAG: tetratricopeptide repeat protein [Candidatus Omnitrophica bacterium]|nr:tetratricopeptide repeat protein [Candidatus Omnitrophota bacterium]
MLELKPDDVAARYNLGKIYQALGLKQEALQEYQAALAIDPASDEILRAMGEIKR